MAKRSQTKRPEKKSHGTRRTGRKQPETNEAGSPFEDRAKELVDHAEKLDSILAEFGGSEPGTANWHESFEQLQEFLNDFFGGMTGQWAGTEEELHQDGRFVPSSILAAMIEHNWLNESDGAEQAADLALRDDVSDHLEEMFRTIARRAAAAEDWNVRLTEKQQVHKNWFGLVVDMLELDLDLCAFICRVLIVELLQHLGRNDGKRDWGLILVDRENDIHFRIDQSWHNRVLEGETFSSAEAVTT
ncbi:MAG: hypothetical protein O2856_17525 [Planctomycetota bacterium]|nr:hypothetical protein [Planctomycetota bacterium]